MNFFLIDEKVSPNLLDIFVFLLLFLCFPLSQINYLQHFVSIETWMHTESITDVDLLEIISEIEY